MASPIRDSRPLVVRKEVTYHKDRAGGHHVCKAYRGDGLTSGFYVSHDERRINWRPAVLLD